MTSKYHRKITIILLTNSSKQDKIFGYLTSLSLFIIKIENIHNILLSYSFFLSPHANYVTNLLC